MDATILARYADACPDCPDRNLVVPYRLLTAEHGRGVVADYRCNRQHPWSTGWAWWDGVPHPTDDTPALVDRVPARAEAINPAGQAASDREAAA